MQAQLAAAWKVFRESLAGKLLLSGQTLGLLVIVAAIFFFGRDPATFDERVRPALRWLLALTWLALALWALVSYANKRLPLLAARFVGVLVLSVLVGPVMEPPLQAVFKTAPVKNDPAVAISLPDGVVALTDARGTEAVLLIVEAHADANDAVTIVSNRYEGTISQDGTTFTIKRGDKDATFKSLATSLAQAKTIYLLPAK